MQVEVKKTAGGSFIVQMGEAMARLDEPDMKRLLLAASRALSDAGTDVGGDAAMDDLVRRLANANDVGIQILIGKADHDDIVTLLKAAEERDATLEKLYANMSDNNRKVCVEDLAFRFKDKPPTAVMGESARRLRKHIRDIEDDGVRLFS